MFTRGYFPRFLSNATHLGKASAVATLDRLPATPFSGIQENCTRSYRLDQILDNAQKEDIILARQERHSAFSFLRFQGCRSLDIARRLLLFPPELRLFHVVIGRETIPCDFYADIDIPKDVNGEKILLDILYYLEVRLEALGFRDSETLILTGNSPQKSSYHLHIRSPHACFNDYRTLKILAEEVNQAIGRDAIDEQCYRLHGMLRLALNGKAHEANRELVPLIKAEDTALQQRLRVYHKHLEGSRKRPDDSLDLIEGEDGDADNAIISDNSSSGVKSGRLRSTSTVEKSKRSSTSSSSSIITPSLQMNLNSQARIVDMSLCCRFKLPPRMQILRPKDINSSEKPMNGGGEDSSDELDAAGNPVSRYLAESTKWRRYQTVQRKLRQFPPRTAESYDTWVRVGLALHNFSNEDHIFEEWVRFSLKCPMKYSRESCRRKWIQFERNPDALNWRRGFNYLNTTLWRGLGK